MASFLARQRIPPGSHMSAWFHGVSVLGSRNDTEQRPQADRKVSQHHHSVLTARSRLENYSPGLRSPTSTRSLIDPLQSPINFSRPLTYDPFMDRPPIHGSYVHPAFTSPAAISHPPKKRRIAYRHHLRPKQDHKAPRRTCLPYITDPHIRQKTFGTLISGIILIIVLTICM